MNPRFLIMFFVFIVSCDIFDTDSQNQNGLETKLYVALQGLDQVGVYDVEGMELIRTVDTDFNQDQIGNTPHFIAIDEENGYWFVTTISSGYVAMYDLESDMLIDTVMVGDSPALMTLDKQQMRVYCSRMMPMGGMMSSSVSQVIQQLDYSTGELVPIGEFTVDSPAPHGITLDMDKDQIITASNTADWIYKIDLTSGNVTGQALDSQTYAPPNIEIQRLKPIQCVTVAPDKVLLTCSAGIWMNPYTGEETHIPGTIQLWDVSTMSILDTLQLNWHSKPWHAVKSQSSNKIFIALSGDILAGESAGAACVRYDNNELSFEWVHRSEEFHILHGIDITADESKIFISSRSNGELYTLDGQTGELISTMLLSVNPDMVMAGGVAVMKNN